MLGAACEGWLCLPKCGHQSATKGGPSSETPGGPAPQGPQEEEPALSTGNKKEERDSFTLFLDETEGAEPRKAASEPFLAHRSSLVDLGARGPAAGIFCLQHHAR